MLILMGSHVRPRTQRFVTILSHRTLRFTSSSPISPLPLKGDLFFANTIEKASGSSSSLSIMSTPILSVLISLMVALIALVAWSYITVN